MQIFRKQKRLNIKRLFIKILMLLLIAAFILLTGCGHDVRKDYDRKYFLNVALLERAEEGRWSLYGR